MLDKEEVQEAIDKFRKYVVQQSRSNLTKQKKNASKSLYNSIKGVSKVNPNSISLYFEMEAHGVFQDKGVNGVGPAGKDRFGNPKEVVRNGQYKFGTGTGKKGGLTKGIDKWMVRRGIAPRDAKGRLISRKSLKFLIARSIYRHGIKPSMFFTKPFEVAYDRLPDELVEAYGIDIIKLYVTND
jgi:hypothetical protein